MVLTIFIAKYIDIGIDVYLAFWEVGQGQV